MPVYAAAAARRRPEAKRPAELVCVAAPLTVASGPRSRGCDLRPAPGVVCDGGASELRSQITAINKLYRKPDLYVLLCSKGK